MAVQYQPAPSLSSPPRMANPAAVFVDSLQVGLKLGKLMKDTFNIESPNERAKRKEFGALLAKPDKGQSDYARAFELFGERGYKLVWQMQKGGMEIQKLGLEIDEKLGKQEQNRLYSQLAEKEMKGVAPEETDKIGALKYRLNPERALRDLQYKEALKKRRTGELDVWKKEEEFKDNLMADLRGVPETERRAHIDRQFARMRLNPRMDRSFVERVARELNDELTDPGTRLFATDERLEQAMMSGGGLEDMLKREKEDRMQADLDRKIESDEARGLQAMVNSIETPPDIRAKAQTRLNEVLGLGSPNKAAADDPLNPGGPGAVVAAATGAPAAPTAADPAADPAAAPGPGPTAVAPAAPAAPAAGPGPAAPSLLRPGGRIDDRRAADIAAQREADQAAQPAAAPEPEPAPAPRQMPSTGQVADKMIEQVDQRRQERQESNERAAAGREAAREKNWKSKNPDLTEKVGNVDATFRSTSAIEVDGKNYEPKNYPPEEAKRIKRWLRKFRDKVYFQKDVDGSIVVLTKGDLKALSWRKWRGRGRTALILQAK